MEKQMEKSSNTADESFSRINFLDAKKIREFRKNNSGYIQVVEQHLDSILSQSLGMPENSGRISFILYPLRNNMGIHADDMYVNFPCVGVIVHTTLDSAPLSNVISLIESVDKELNVAFLRIHGVLVPFCMCVPWGVGVECRGNRKYRRYGESEMRPAETSEKWALLAKNFTRSDQEAEYQAVVETAIEANFEAHARRGQLPAIPH